MSTSFHDPAYDGTWQILNAQTHTGFSYTGTMTITPAAVDGHRVDWKTSAGDYDAIGLVIEGRLFLAFGREADGYGLAVYEEAPSGIEAVFTSQVMKGATGRERVPGCKSFAALNNTYEMQGETHEQKTYAGQVAFAPHGDVFLVTWAFKDTPGRIVGVGMVRHNRLVVAYGNPDVLTFGCGCYALQADGTLKGEWGIPSFQTTVKELYGKPGTGAGERAPG